MRDTPAVDDPDGMTDISTTQATDGVPTYLGRGDPAGSFADYYPAWVDKLAGDVTLEGSKLDGALQGPDAIRAVIGGVRELYDRQDFNFAGPWGDNSFIEDYAAEVRGRSLGCFHLVPARRPDPAGAGEDLPRRGARILFQHHAEFARDVDAFLRQ